MAVPAQKINSPFSPLKKGGGLSPQQRALIARQQIGGPLLEYISNEPSPISFEVYKETGQRVTLAKNIGNGFPMRGSSAIEYDVAKADPNLNGVDVLKDPDVSSTNYLQKLIKPLDSLGGVTISAVEAVGKVAPKALQDSKEAMVDLLGNYIIGKQKKEPTPEEKTKLEREKIAYAHHRQILQQAEAKKVGISEKNAMERALGIIGKEVAAMSETEQNRRRKISASYQRETIMSIHEAVELRAIKKCDEDAIKRAEVIQTMREVSKGSNIVLDAVAEGGTGGGKINISSTGGGGAG